MIELRSASLGFALAEFDHGVVESAENTGERIRQYHENVDPPIPTAAPWCAMWLQYVTDVPAEHLRAYNPFNEVRQEALVQSYVDWATEEGLVVPPWKVRAGDIVAFEFSEAGRWNHIGMVSVAPTNHGQFETLEGNTSPGVGVTEAEAEREGDGVYWKIRELGGSYPVLFFSFP